MEPNIPEIIKTMSSRPFWLDPDSKVAGDDPQVTRALLF